MTKREFMYAVGITDPDQLENIMLLCGDNEPADGNWLKLMRKWYSETVDRMNKYESLYYRYRFSRPTE